MRPRKLRSPFRRDHDDAPPPPPAPPAEDDGDPSPEATWAPRATPPERAAPTPARQAAAGRAREIYRADETRVQEYLRRLALAGISEKQLTAEGIIREFSSMEARLIWRDFSDLALERVATEDRIMQRQREGGDREAGA